LVTPAGAFTEFLVPTPSGFPIGIAAGPDGNVWFTENAGNKIGKLTVAGRFREFPIPTANSGCYGITAGLDGNLWFTEETFNKIGRITPAGAFSEFSVPTPVSHPYFGITAGPDGNIWFVEHDGNNIASIRLRDTVPCARHPLRYIPEPRHTGLPLPVLTRPGETAHELS
jgi:virginiamycin B lyase